MGQAALFWQCFNVLPKSLQGGTPGQLETFQGWLAQVEPQDITRWQESNVYAAHTSQKPLVQPKDVLNLILTIVVMLLGEEVELPKAEKTREELFKAL